MDGITFFGEVDRKKEIVGDKVVSRITSTFPAWYLDRNIQEMENEINMREGMLSRGETPPEEVPYAKEEIAKLTKRRNEIVGSKPRIEGKDKDDMVKAWKETGDNIREAMFTYDQMERGTADAHKEAERMSTPCVKLPSTLAKLTGIELDRKGLVTRTEAERAWKIGAKFLDESTNVEELRRKS